MLDGAARIGEVVGAAVADGQPAIGITDHGNMYGILDFYKECRKQGVKPILGTEAYMAHDSPATSGPARRGRVDDSGGDAEGGKKLYYHLTAAGREQRRLQEPHPARQPGLHGGLLLQAPGRLGDCWPTTPRASSPPPAAWAATSSSRCCRATSRGPSPRPARLQDIFGRDNLFVELQDHGIPEQHKTNPQLLEIARRIGAPLLATNDSHYVHRDDAVAHDALLCVQTGSLMSDPNRFKFHGDEHYLKTGGRDALAVRRGARVVRQHAVDRRAGQRRDRLRQAPAAQLPAARGLHRPTATTCATSPSRAPASAGATSCPTPWSSAWPTSSRSSATWASARTSSSCGT